MSVFVAASSVDFEFVKELHLVWGFQICTQIQDWSIPAQDMCQPILCDKKMSVFGAASSVDFGFVTGLHLVWGFQISTQIQD
jgi:hypothetical protein